jgi:hypothetical protein
MRLILATLFLVQIYALYVGAYNTEKWMEQLSSEIGDVKYSNIKIPATHNSGSWNISDASPYSYDTNLDPSFMLIPQLVYIFGAYGVNGSLVKRWLNPWMRNQEKTITKQLKDGIRHFDIRVCKSPLGPVVCHALESVTVESVFQDVHNFLEDRTGEVVSIDINHIYGLTTVEKVNLARSINGILGNSTLVDPSLRSFQNTYDELMDVGERVFLFMSDSYTVANYGRELRLFHSSNLPTPWVNTVDMAVLKSGILTGLNNRVDMSRGFVSQIVLTPNLNMMVSGLLDKPSSIKDLVKMEYSVIPDWIRYDLPKDKVNIVNTNLYSDKFVKSIINLNL